GSMEKESPVLGAFCQCPLHLAARFSQVACCSQRPGQSVVTEDISARIKFRSREPKRSFGRLASRCEKQRQRTGIPGWAVLAKLRLNRRRFILPASYAQRLSKRPLIFGKRISLHGILQSVHGIAEPVLSKQDFSLQ